METPKEMRMKIVGKAAEDADFRARLLGDPEGSHRAGAGRHHSCIPGPSRSTKKRPARPRIWFFPPAAQLSESDLRAVAGGATYDENGVRIDDDWNPVADW